MARMSRPEFIALIAMMFATIAFSVDAMLPALPDIAAELSPGAENNAQLVLTFFVMGLGCGTLFVGPVSDALGRKPVILFGAALYIVAAFLASIAESLELLLAARLLQGLGAACPRVVAVAIMRDLYSGRIMARMLSIAMMIFTIFPAFAPLIGAGIIALSGWRAIFLAFVLFAIIFSSWMGFRLSETLPPEKRRPVRARLLIAALREMMGNATVRLSIAVQTLCMGAMFCMLTMVQPVYDTVYGRAESFPVWFAGVAVVTALASVLNAAIVVRVGMRAMVTWTLAGQVLFSGAMLWLGSVELPDALAFGLFVAWQGSIFFMAGTTLGNLNAIAMEPMGHIAGLAASVMGAISTVLAAGIAGAIGLTFDGSLRPLALGIFSMTLIGLGLMWMMMRSEADEAVGPEAPTH